MRKQRKDKVKELLALISRGPSLGFPGNTITVAEAESNARIWLNTWVEPLVMELMPELKKELLK